MTLKSPLSQIQRYRKRYEGISIQEGDACSYLLRATFDADNQNYADAQVLDTVAEGVQAGQLTVVEVDGTLAIVSNKCAFTAPATPAFDALGAYSQQMTKQLGYAFIGTMNLALGTNTKILPAWWSAANLATGSRLFDFNTSNSALYAHMAGETGPFIGQITAATDYEVAIVLGGYNATELPWYSGQTPADYLYGAAYYIKGGAFTTWTLLWRWQYSNTSAIYAGFCVHNETGTMDDFRVPDASLSAVLAPTCLSLFTAGNGTSLDAITPEVGGGWTERSADWQIQSNKATLTATATGYATIDTTIADCIIDATCNPGATDAAFGLIFRWTGSTAFWLLSNSISGDTLQLYEQNAGWTLRASTATNINADTDYDFRVIAYGQTIDAFQDGGNKLTYGSASFNETATKHGLRLESALQTADNFAVYPRTAAIYDSELDAC